MTAHRVNGRAGVALVVGGSGGLGSAVASMLSHRGHPTVVHYHLGKERAEAVASDLPGPSLCVGADVRCSADVSRMEEAIYSSMGAVEVLVNCAAIRNDGLLAGQSSGEWRDVIDVNLVGSFNVIRAVLPRMLKRRRGAIVNVVSPAALIGSPGQTAYSASKAGLVGLTKALAHEVGRRGICINAVSPGFMETDLTTGVAAAWKDRLLERTPLRRFTDPSEVAAAIALVLDLPYATGQVVSIDGGVSA